MCGAGWRGSDSRDGRRLTTKTGRWRDAEARGDRDRGRLPGGLVSSRRPECRSWEPSQRERPAPAASPPAGPPAAARPSRPGLQPLPRAASLLPLPHFLLLSLCQTHLELFKPKYSAPSPSSQIPPQFKTSPALAPGGGSGGRGRRRGGAGRREGEKERGRQGGSSFLFNFWGAREGGRGSAPGHRSALAIAQSRHIFPINEERTWVSSHMCLKKGSGHSGGEGAACSRFPRFSEGERRSLLPSACAGTGDRARPSSALGCPVPAFGSR